jgi:N-acetylglucosamine kinase-like BadF-type ATPase
MSETHSAAWPSSAGGAARPAAVLAVDGGNSKTEVVLLDAAGTVIGAARGPGSNHVHSDHDTVMKLIDDLVRRAGESLDPHDRPVADVAVLCLAGADYPYDERRLAAAAAPFRWADRTRVCNDALAMLRAGTDDVAAVAVICGAGTNCYGRDPRGRTVRFPALGYISGDWGGGYDIGMAGLMAAVRAEDGRGPRTALQRLVPGHFGLAKPSSLVFAIYTERVHERQITELPPVVFAASDDGDEVARGIVDRQADELAVMASAAIRRLQLSRQPVTVVLGGGIVRSGNERLLERATAGIRSTAPAARLVLLDAAPVAGAALLGLDQLGIAPAGDVRRAVGAALQTGEST